MLTAGQLDQRITIQRDEVSHVAGVETRTPATLATTWADVRPVSGREALQSEMVQSEVRYRVLIRYREDVRATDRVLWRALALEITDVLLDRPNWTTTLMCRMVNP